MHWDNRIAAEKNFLPTDSQLVNPNGKNKPLREHPDNGSLLFYLSGTSVGWKENELVERLMSNGIMIKS